MICVSIFVVFLVGAPALALDILGARERTCVPVASVPVDQNWVVQPNFYFPMMSRYYLYKNVAQISSPIDPAKIIEGSIYYDACLRDQISVGACLISGYMGKRETDYFNVAEPNSNGGIAFRPKYSSGFNGTFWFTKTDNKSYVVAVLCDGDNQMMWKVIATTPTLPSLLSNQITQHVINDLGFKQAYFTELRYDTCILRPGETGWSSVH